MRRIKNHRIVKDIIESLKIKITGNKNASRASVIIVAFILIIALVAGKFGKYVGANKLFPHLIAVICRNHESDTSGPDVTNNTDIENTVWSEQPNDTTKIPVETTQSTYVATKRNDWPTASRAEDSNNYTSEAVLSTIDLQPNDSSPPTDETTKNSIAKNITVSYIPIEFPLTDKNAEIRAVTSFEATKVILVCEANGFKYGEWDMKTSDSHMWTFDADFYESNTYTLTVIAYDSNGEQARESIDVKYPF